MHNQILLLRDIQLIDMEVSRIKRFQEDFPGLLKALEEELNACREQHKAENETLEQKQKDRRKLEQIVEEQDNKIRKYQEQLFQVKTNKEYQALLSEIDLCQQRKKDEEEHILKFMEEMEILAGEAKERAARFNAEEKKFADEIALLNEKLTHSQNEMQEKMAQVDKMKQEIKPALFKTYMRIKERRGGQAVVQVINGVCLGCNLNIPPQMFIEILKDGGLYHCPNCQRILFHVPEEPAAA